MYKNLRNWLLAALLFSVAACSDDDKAAPPAGRYDNGFFLVSEGNYSVAAGDLSFYDYNKDTIYTNVYSFENPGKKLGTPVTTMEYGTIHNGTFYLVGKYDGPFVALDAATLKETARVDSLPGHDGRAFIAIDNNRGLLSTVVGLYPVTLPDLTLGTKVSSVDGEIKDMLKVGNYIFVLSVNDGIVVLNADNYNLVKKLGNAVSGFAQGKDGSVWAASVTQLKKINASTLGVDSITTSFPIFYNEWTYYNSSIAASATEDAVFVISGSNKVYRYTGDAASLAAPFITLPAGQYFYGKGIGYDKTKNYLVLNTNTNEYGSDPDNTIYIYNATTGALQHSTSLHGYYFPGMVVFR